MTPNLASWLRAGWIGKYLSLFLTNDSGGLFVTGEFMDRIAGFVRPATAMVA